MSITKDIWSSLLRRETRSSLLVFLALTLASFVLSPTARAVDPPPDGGYPYQNSAVTRDGWRWIVDAHREGRRYIVHSDELLSAFLELEATLL